MSHRRGGAAGHRTPISSSRLTGRARLSASQVASSVMGQVEVQPGALDGVEAAELTVATGLALDEVPA